MMQIKTGLGYDIHRFIDGRPLFLGGVEIPHHRGLDGHSDADVVLHAVCDALLGALGNGDIGEHFPNTDPAYKDISSLRLLEQVKALVDDRGYKISNMDVMIQAEEPNLKEYKVPMQACMAATLGLDMGDVNIKATTLEGIGALGKAEGIAAFATTLLIKE